jgi:homoserine dehydrogenase
VPCGYQPDNPKTGNETEPGEETLEPVKVGLLGLGTVGGGTLNVLHRNAAEISRRAGRDIRIVHAAARQYDPAGLDGIERIPVTDDAFEVVNNPEVEIVVELIGG